MFFTKYDSYQKTKIKITTFISVQCAFELLTFNSPYEMCAPTRNFALTNLPSAISLLETAGEKLQG